MSATMGQQQILLLTLAVIIVGIATIVGITMFTATAASANMDAVVNDLLKLGAKAQQYYLKPTNLGGGGGSFKGMSMADLTTKPSNENGKYSIKTTRKRKVVLRGIGKLDGDGNNKKVRILLRVFADSCWVIEKQR